MHLFVILQSVSIKTPSRPGRRLNHQTITAPVWFFRHMSFHFYINVLRFYRMRLRRRMQFKVWFRFMIWIIGDCYNELIRQRPDEMLSLCVRFRLAYSALPIATLLYVLKLWSISKILSKGKKKKKKKKRTRSCSEIALKILPTPKTAIKLIRNSSGIRLKLLRKSCKSALILIPNSSGHCTKTALKPLWNCLVVFCFVL